MSGGKSLAATMQTKSIVKLASFFDVDFNVANIFDDLVNSYDQSINTLNPNDIDIVAKNLDRCTTDTGVMSPVNAYPQVAMAVAEEIISRHPDEAARIRQKRIDGDLMIDREEEPLDELEIGEEPIRADIERTPEEREAIEETSQTTRAEQLKTKDPSVVMPPKIEVTRKTTGHVTHRFARQSWGRKKRMVGFSVQETFVATRRGKNISDIQSEFAGHFKIFRSEASIKIKMKRLARRESLEKEEREERGGMLPE